MKHWSGIASSQLFDIKLFYLSVRTTRAILCGVINSIIFRFGCFSKWWVIKKKGKKSSCSRLAFFTLFTCGSVLFDQYFIFFLHMSTFFFSSNNCGKKQNESVVPVSSPLCTYVCVYVWVGYVCIKQQKPWKKSVLVYCMYTQTSLMLACFCVPFLMLIICYFCVFLLVVYLCIRV